MKTSEKIKEVLIEVLPKAKFESCGENWWSNVEALLTNAFEQAVEAEKLEE